MMKRLLLPPMFCLLTITLMIVLHFKYPLMIWLSPPYNWLGLIAIAVGFAMANWHAQLFRQLGTNINTFDEPGVLTKKGLFRRTRNPMYLGMLIILLGVSSLLGSITPLVGPMMFFVIAQTWYIPIEERAMSRKFGNQYLEYQRSVARWL